MHTNYKLAHNHKYIEINSKFIFVCRLFNPYDTYICVDTSNNMNGAAAVPFDSMGNDEKFKNKLVGSWMCAVWCACMRLYLLESSKMSLFDRKNLPMDTIRRCRPTRNGFSLAPTDVIDNLLLKFNYCSLAAGLMYAFSICT